MKKITLLLLLFATLYAKAQFIEARTDSFKTKVPLRLMNIGEGAGKVLTSDAQGRATWQTPANGSGLWSVSGLAGNEIMNTNAGGFWSGNPSTVPYPATNVTNPPTAPASGAGTRLMWIPSRSAFRVGTTNGTAWDASNVGLHSFASGYNSRATGTGNVAIGTNAISDGTSNTIAIGENTNSSGNNAVSIGTGTNANAYYSLALGYNNSPIGTASATAWVSTDPLLYIGNGQTSGSLSNAMVIQKNGVVNIGVTPTSTTTYKLKLGGSMSATGTVQASSLRATGLSGESVRHVCTDESGNLISCSAGESYYNVSALGFHPIFGSTTPNTAFLRNVERSLISFANNTKSTEGYAFAPVELPDGVTVSKIAMNYLQNAGGSIILTFYKVEKQTNAIGDVEATLTSNQGSGILETSDTLSKGLLIENNKYYYYLKVTAGVNWQGSDMALRGVVFTYNP